MKDEDEPPTRTQFHPSSFAYIRPASLFSLRSLTVPSGDGPDSEVELPDPTLSSLCSRSLRVSLLVASESVPAGSGFRSRSVDFCIRSPLDKPTNYNRDGYDYRSINTSDYIVRHYSQSRLQRL